MGLEIFTLRRTQIFWKQKNKVYSLTPVINSEETVL